MWNHVLKPLALMSWEYLVKQEASFREMGAHSQVD
uniref:Uncharacterized protein n=1 Tax=Arundo donax TaxID=35708 RepID=A0A0A9BNU6_ARUDO